MGLRPVTTRARPGLQGPTRPTDDPLFGQGKPDCQNNPQHPSCKDGDGGGAYTATDLKLCKRCDGIAHDISEPDEDALHVIGHINEPMGWPRIAVVWTGTLDDIGDAPWVILSTPGYPGPGSGSPGEALGINDIANSIVGWNYVFAQPPVPVIWEAEGGGWADGQLLKRAGFDGGNARDVNNAGLIVGRLTSSADTVAAMWSSPGAEPVKLEMDPVRFSAALGLNNQGDVVGWTWNASGEQAVLWTAGGMSCDLNPVGSKSVAIRVDDRDGKTVLVAGRVTPAGQPRQPAVWTVDVTNCGAASYALIAGAGRALDVRHGEAGWQAVGDDETGREARPIVWFEPGTSSEQLHGKNGLAYVISGAGHIAGYRENKGSIVPAVWTKK